MNFMFLSWKVKSHSLLYSNVIHSQWSTESHKAMSGNKSSLPKASQEDLVESLNQDTAVRHLYDRAPLLPSPLLPCWRGKFMFVTWIYKDLCLQLQTRLKKNTVSAYIVWCFWQSTYRDWQIPSVPRILPCHWGSLAHIESHPGYYTFLVSKLRWLHANP